jgi:flagella basal body P-ring formation protein FlgA
LHAATAVAQDDAADEIVIELAAHAQVGNEFVRLADVAEISAGPEDRRRLAELDVAAFDAAGTPRLIPRRVIEMRLRLAGFDPADIRLGGSEEVIVVGAANTELTDARVEEAAAAAIRQQLGAGEGDLRVTLAGPVVAQWRRQDSLPPHVRLEVIPSAEELLGRVTCACRLLDGDRLIASHAAAFHVARKHHVIVATASLSPGQAMSAGVLREEFRYLAAPVDELTLQQVQGRSLRMPLTPGETLTLRHLSEETAAENAIVIRSRDAVHVTARKGGLKVVVRGAEALQNGSVGQVIRVRNIESNRIITGRVAGPGEVEIDLN